MYLSVAVSANTIRELRLTKGHVVLIGYGPTVADRTGNERHFLDLFFHVGLIPRMILRMILRMIPRMTTDRQKVGRSTNDLGAFHTLRMTYVGGKELRFQTYPRCVYDMIWFMQLFR